MIVLVFWRRLIPHSERRVCWERGDECLSVVLLTFYKTWWLSVIHLFGSSFSDVLSPRIGWVHTENDPLFVWIWYTPFLKLSYIYVSLQSILTKICIMESITERKWGNTWCWWLHFSYHITNVAQQCSDTSMMVMNVYHSATLRSPIFP